jgi:hypothetical protein
MPKIPCDSANFSPRFGPAFLGYNEFNCRWSEIVWVALTVGKPDSSYLHRYGNYSFFERLYRTALLFSNLKQTRSNTLWRSEVYDKGLDPSEKSAVSYFLGLTFAKLFAEKLLNTPWLMHLGLYSQRNPKSLTTTSSKSSPDLIGLNNCSEWIVVEAKGRTGMLPDKLLQKAKHQTRMLRKISGQFPSLRVATAVYFNSQPRALSVSWEDPEQLEPNSIDLDIDPALFFEQYYLPFFAAFNSQLFPIQVQTINQQPFRTIVFNQVDLKIGLHERLFEGYTYASRLFAELSLSTRGLETDESHYIGGDGIFVELGSSWQDNNMRKQPASRK